MITATQRQLILTALVGQLQLITIANGYNTDAGLAVYLGVSVDLGEDDADVAIAVVPETDEVAFQGANVLVRLPIEIQAIAKASLDQPWLAVEELVADIKRAVETEDRTLGGVVRKRLERGSTRTLEREPGALSVGCSITYVAPYVEGWGTP